MEINLIDEIIVLICKMCRKSVENEFEGSSNLADDGDDGAKAVIAEEQVANKMQRLNLFFEKENVKTHFICICWIFFVIFCILLHQHNIHIWLFCFFLFLLWNNKKVDADEVKSRQEYLRTQRDKIVALKRRVRTEQLNANAERNPAGDRPSSAQAAQRLLLSEAKPSDAPMKASLQLRKTLAHRLRNEVVDSKE